MDFPKKNDSDQRSTEYFLHDDIHQKNENPPTGKMLPKIRWWPLLIITYLISVN